MRSVFICLIVLGSSAFAQAQSIDKLLKSYNNHSVPYISVQELAMKYDDYVVLDTRKKEEFDVSHLPNAVWVGEKHNPLENLVEDSDIVVYCSVGIRSENYGEELLDAGFKNVKNLYGSIFAWKDAGFEVVDKSGKVTDNVHTFSKTWSKYLKSGNKIYGKDINN